MIVIAVFAATALAQLGTLGRGVLGRLPFGGSLLLNLLLLAALFQVLTGIRLPWRRLPGAAVGAASRRTFADEVNALARSDVLEVRPARPGT